MLKFDKKRIILAVFISIFFFGMLLPEKLVIPVKNATNKDWNHNSFWYEPWGKSGVHKGIDIFSPIGTPVYSTTYGIVIYKGTFSLGGNIVAILGPKWRIHYYAHLKEINSNLGWIVKTKGVIGKVGDSGNAKGKSSHLHYTILSTVPYLWNWDSATQGWKKVFYLNPTNYLLKN